MATPQLIVGKWYKLPNRSNYYVKYKSENNCSEYITAGKEYRNYSGYCNTDDAILLSSEDIYQYLPDGHVDKVKTTEKWSVGTYVVWLVSSQKGNIERVTHPRDRICTYLEHYGTCSLNRERDGEIKWFATKQEAEAFSRTLVTPSIEKWSVGTYVVFTKDFTTIRPIGFVDKITESTKGAQLIQLATYKSLDIDRERKGEVKWFATKDEAESFAKTLTSSEPSQTYKIGDWIKILNDGSTVSHTLTDTGDYHYGAKIDDIVQIKGISFNDGNASPTDPRYYGDKFNLRKKDFRRALPSEIPTTSTSSDLKVGDWVYKYDGVDADNYNQITKVDSDRYHTDRHGCYTKSEFPIYFRKENPPGMTSSPLPTAFPEVEGIPPSKYHVLDEQTPIIIKSKIKSNKIKVL